VPRNGLDEPAAQRRRGDHVARQLFLRDLRHRDCHATLATAPSPSWGTGSTSVGSDSTHFRAYGQNTFTEWHSRYGAAES